MKDKNAVATVDASADCDCCKGDGASCPMKMGGAAAADSKMGDQKSCPMMKGNADQNVKVSADGKSCSCACCASEKETKDASAV